MENQETKRIRKIDMIRADLPGKRVIGNSWLVFNMTCSLKDVIKHRRFLKTALADFERDEADKKAVFIAEGWEEDTVETADGDQKVAISTVFVTVEGVSPEQCSKLNALLRSLFSSRTSDNESDPPSAPQPAPVSDDDSSNA